MEKLGELLEEAGAGGPRPIMTLLVYRSLDEARQARATIVTDLKRRDVPHLASDKPGESHLSVGSANISFTAFETE